jgi:hypothetical protein
MVFAPVPVPIRTELVVRRSEVAVPFAPPGVPPQPPGVPNGQVAISPKSPPITCPGALKLAKLNRL